MTFLSHLCYLNEIIIFIDYFISNLIYSFSFFHGFIFKFEAKITYVSDISKIKAAFLVDFNIFMYEFIV